MLETATQSLALSAEQIRQERITKLLDGTTEGYAFAYLDMGREYGHMTLDIYPGFQDRYARPNCTIRVTCQIGGGTEDQLKKPYAEKWGLTPFYDSIGLDDMERFIKVMRGIEKRLKDFTDELGYAKSYAELCQRILVGSKVRCMVAFSNMLERSAHTKVDHRRLIYTGGDTANHLQKMEAFLIDGFANRQPLRT